ncbi:MAG: glycosyltransferase [Methanobacterium sp.]|jgi:glycosyltransferase involved in cell wall biosynthesis|nr:glycosyltransferase [Methanobacterium sp.]
MSRNPRVSVLMAVYNGTPYLSESIESILHQEWEDFEFIIVNDASTDNSQKIIETYSDGRIQLINNQKNLGLTRSLNKALQYAEGEYVARQDADDVSIPSRLQKQVSFLDEHPQVALVGSSVFRIDKNGKIIGEVVNRTEPSFSDMLDWNHFKHGSVMFNKSIICDLRGYNPLFRYAQDHDLWIRVSRDHPVMNLTETLYKLRIHNESIGSRKIEESRLYSLLSKKMALNQTSPTILAKIEENGIKSFYSVLSHDEICEIKKSVHIIKSGIHLENEDIELARKEYKAIFRLDPWDPSNNLNLLRSYMGLSGMKVTSNIFNKFNRFKRIFRE